MEMTLNKAVAPLPVERSPGYWTTVCRGCCATSSPCWPR
jgi:hypothetical protein